MSRILIGNIKGPQGAQGIQGPQGPVGATGPQGPMPDLINNALATQAGVAALDAVMGKTLQDQITQLNSELSVSVNKFNTEYFNNPIHVIKTGHICTIIIHATTIKKVPAWTNIVNVNEFLYERMSIYFQSGNGTTDLFISDTGNLQSQGEIAAEIFVSAIVTFICA